MRVFAKIIFASTTVAFGTGQASMSFGQTSFEIDRRVPEEYETTGGHSLGLGNSGVASQNGIAAVKLNPGLLPINKQYSISGGYNWPTTGREFYQAGIIDSQSSDIAAGFIFNGFADDYGEDPTTTGKDARTKRRATLALAKAMKKISLGVSGQYVEALANPATGREIKGTTLGFGLAGFISPEWRFGASVENLANRKVAEYAPRMVRAGISYLYGSAVIASFDVRQRERVVQMEQGFGAPLDTDNEQLLAAQREQEKLDEEYKDPEWMAFASVNATVYDMIQLLGGYGQAMNGPDRRSLSGGIAVGTEKFSLSYTASRPYLDEPEAQQAINATINVSM